MIVVHAPMCEIEKLSVVILASFLTLELTATTD